MSEGFARRFITKLGWIRDQIDAFMKALVMPGTTLLFDGTSIFSRAADSLSAKEYNPEHSQNPQARSLYIVEKDSHKPVFYQGV